MHGDSHCHQAYTKEGGNEFVDTGQDWMRFVLSFIILWSCLLIIIPVVYMGKYFFGTIPNPDIVHIVFEERLEATNRQLKNVVHMIEENSIAGSGMVLEKKILTDKAIYLAEKVKNQINLIVKLNS